MRTLVLSIFLAGLIHGCIGDVNPFSGRDEQVVLAQALMEAVDFDGATVIEGALPASTADRVTITPLDQTLIMAPGEPGVAVFDVDNADEADDPVASTRLQFAAAAGHLVIPAATKRPVGMDDAAGAGSDRSLDGGVGTKGGAPSASTVQRIENAFAVDSDVCAELCDKIFAIEMTEAAELDSGALGARSTRTLLLDCRDSGTRSACADGATDDVTEGELHDAADTGSVGGTDNVASGNGGAAAPPMNGGVGTGGMSGTAGDGVAGAGGMAGTAGAGGVGGGPDAGILEPPLPVAMQACPSIVQGDNRFLGRTVHIWHGDAATYGPLVFYWHAVGSTPSEATTGLGAALAMITDAGGVVAAMDATGGSGTSTGTGTWYYEDFDVADEVLACAVEQLGVDTTHIHSVGMSAGALQSTAMGYARSGYLASFVSYSGGLLAGTTQTIPQDPSNMLPALITHGGPNDVVVVSFADTSLALQADLSSRGHYTILCDHGRGHSIPTELPADGGLYRFLAEHPFGIQRSPWEGSPLPSPEFPAFCTPYRPGEQP